MYDEEDHLRELCILLMTNDPWDQEADRATLVDLADSLARDKGFDDWIAFYHAH